MASALFCYGTLSHPEVMRALTGRVFPWSEATLEGFACFRVRGQSYPGIVEAPQARTAGLVYLALDPRALALLDAFEGELYERRRVCAVQGGRRAEAFAYVVADAFRERLSDEPWDRGHLAAQDLPRYLAGCRAFRGARSAR